MAIVELIDDVAMLVAICVEKNNSKVSKPSAYFNTIGSKVKFQSLFQP